MSTSNSKTSNRAPRQEARLIDLDRVVVQKEFKIGKESFGAFNKRKNFGDLKAMGQSMKENFEKDPFSITPIRGHFEGRKFILTNGERRYRAALEAGMTQLPYLPFSKNPLDRLVAQAQLNAGKDFNDYEKADLMRSIATALTLQFPEKYPSTKDTATRDEVMRLQGISRPSWYNYWKVLEAPKEVQELVETEQLSATSLRQIMVGKKSPSQVVKEAKALVEEVQSNVAAAETASAQDKSTAGSSNTSGKQKRKPKATSKDLKKSKAKKTPFQQKPFSEKYEAVIEKVASSGTPGAQFLLALDHALKNEEKNLTQIVELVNSANLKPAKAKK